MFDRKVPSEFYKENHDKIVQTSIILFNSINTCCIDPPKLAVTYADMGDRASWYFSVAGYFLFNSRE